MYGNCVDQKVQASCASLKCDASSICLMGMCFPVFNNFNVFGQNKPTSFTNIKPIINDKNPGNTVNPLDAITNKQCNP